MRKGELSNMPSKIVAMDFESCFSLKYGHVGLWLWKRQSWYLLTKLLIPDNAAVISTQLLGPRLVESLFIAGVWPLKVNEKVESIIRKAGFWVEGFKRFDTQEELDRWIRSEEVKCFFTADSFKIGFKKQLWRL